MANRIACDKCGADCTGTHVALKASRRLTEFGHRMAFELCGPCGENLDAWLDGKPVAETRSVPTVMRRAMRAMCAMTRAARLEGGADPSRVESATANQRGQTRTMSAMTEARSFLAAHPRCVCGKRAVVVGTTTRGKRVTRCRKCSDLMTSK